MATVQSTAGNVIVLKNNQSGFFLMDINFQCSWFTRSGRGLFLVKISTAYETVRTPQNNAYFPTAKKIAF